MKEFDDTFEFAGYHKTPSRCRIRVYSFPKNNHIVVASDLNEPDTGTSITNAVEFLIPAVVRELKLSLKRLIWVEHYPHLVDDETFDLVQYNIIPLVNGIGAIRWMPVDRIPLVNGIGVVRWMPVDREFVERVIGEELE